MQINDITTQFLISIKFTYGMVSYRLVHMDTVCDYNLNLDKNKDCHDNCETSFEIGRFMFLRNYRFQKTCDKLDTWGCPQLNCKCWLEGGTFVNTVCGLILDTKNFLEPENWTRISPESLIKSHHNCETSFAIGIFILSP